MFQNKLQEHYDRVTEYCETRDDKPEIWVTMLYGSQNYGLDTADSDVDTKSMIIPSLAGLISGNMLSKELTLPDSSLDVCKDLRDMFANYLKGNINFVETLYTKYYICNPKYSVYFHELRKYRDLIANAQPQKLVIMAGGMARQKYLAFDKRFTGKEEVIDIYGYDPKQLHHLVRLKYFISSFIETQSFKEALSCCSFETDSTAHSLLMSLKTDPLPYEDANILRAFMMDSIHHKVNYKNTLPKDNRYQEAKEFLDSLAYKIIKDNLKN